MPQDLQLSLRLASLESGQLGDLLDGPEADGRALSVSLGGQVEVVFEYRLKAKHGDVPVGEHGLLVAP